MSHAPDGALDCSHDTRSRGVGEIVTTFAVDSSAGASSNVRHVSSSVGLSLRCGALFAAAGQPAGHSSSTWTKLPEGPVILNEQYGNFCQAATNSYPKLVKANATLAALSSEKPTRKRGKRFEI